MKKLNDKVQVGNLTLRNRFIFPPMTTGYEERGQVTEKAINFYQTIARGGAALIIIGDVAPVRTLSPIPMLFEDRLIPSFTKLVDAVHEEGAYIGAQIFHPEYDPDVIFKLFMEKDMVGLRKRLHHDMLHFVNEITIEKLQDIQNKMVDAAVRASKAGFDMIQIHGDRIVGALSSPILNKRTDEYGGTLENRTRFATELVTKIREVLPTIAIDYKLAMIRSNPYLGKGGPTIEEGKILAKRLEILGVDSIHACQANHTSVSVTIPAAATAPFKCFTDFAAAIKSVVEIPVSAVGRIVTPDHCQSILDNNEADLVSLGRPLLADPEYVNKILSGRDMEIRYCIMCNKGCTDKIMSRQQVGCAINGNNGLFLDVIPATNPKNIVVVGAGPGGLEAARVLSKRGHNVTVLEKDSKPGGQLNVATVPEHKSEMNNIRRYLLDEISNSNVDVRCNTEATLDVITMLSPDEVILATGATPASFPMLNNHSNVLSAWDVLKGAKVGQKIIVVGAGSVGVEAAGFIKTKDNDVTIVEATENIMNGESSTVKDFLIKDLAKKEIKLLKNSKITEVHADSIVMNDKLEKCDTLVFAVGAKPNNTLEEVLKTNDIKYHIIGDALQPRLLENAIREAFKLSCEI